MTTFSQTIDELVREHVRPDLRPTIVAYLNQTIRELHSDSNSGAPLLFDANRKEAEWTVPSDPASWPVPSVARFQQFETAYYVGPGVYALKRHPSRAFERGIDNEEPYWYRAGAYVIFSGIKKDQKIKMTYFEFPPVLVYYESAQRPAVYDVETDGYTYLPSYDIDETTRENARNLTDNWLLNRWPEVVKQGCRAKIFSRLGEETRAKMSYSLYESQRQGLKASESFVMNQ